VGRGKDGSAVPANPVESRSSHDRLRDSESPCNNAEAPHKVQEGDGQLRHVLKRQSADLAARCRLMGSHLAHQLCTFIEPGRLYLGANLHDLLTKALRPLMLCAVFQGRWQRVGVKRLAQQRAAGGLRLRQRRGLQPDGCAPVCVSGGAIARFVTHPSSCFPGARQDRPYPCCRSCDVGLYAIMAHQFVRRGVAVCRQRARAGRVAMRAAMQTARRTTTRARRHRPARKVSSFDRHRCSCLLCMY